MLRTQLLDPVLARAALGEDGAGLAPGAARVVEELSREFPGAVAELLKVAWLAAYDGGQGFHLTTDGASQEELADFNAAGRVRVVIDFDANGVSFGVTHGEEHAPWYAPGGGS